MVITKIKTASDGFSLIELMVVMAIFLVVTMAVFGLLGSAQVRYRSEQQLIEAMQGARVGMEQLTRDIHRAGYPPFSGYDRTLTSISFDSVNNYVTDRRIAVRIPGMVGGTLTTNCTINTVNPALGTCDIPGPFQLVLEADLDPENPAANQRERVEWIYYRLETPSTTPPTSAPAGGGIRRTLYRMVSDKTLGADPRAAGVARYKGSVVRLVPFIEDVMNDPANGQPDAVFTYMCANAATVCTPNQIQEVQVELRVQTRSPNLLVPATGGQLNYRTVVLRTVARPVNPAQ